MGSSSDKWFAGFLTLALMVTVGRAQTESKVGAPGSQAPGRADSNLRITVWVYNYAQISKRDLGLGEKVVTTVFEKVEIALEWVDCPVSWAEVHAHPVCQRLMLPTELGLVILPSFSGMHLDSISMLGFSQIFRDGTFGHYAYVSFERVEAAARRGPTPEYQILGYVGAHELGHLLLASGAHSACGIMRAKVEDGDYRHLDLGQSAFAPQQAQRIHVEVMARMMQREISPNVQGSAKKMRRRFGGPQIAVPKSELSAAKQVNARGAVRN